MGSTAAKRERAEQILGELAELSLMLARDLATQARAAEDAAETVALTAAFQKMARTARLTLALDFKLDRDAARDAAAAVKAAEEAAAETALRENRLLETAEAARRDLAPPPPAENQKQRVRNVLNRLLWNESEGDQEEYEVLVDDLDARLYEAEDAPGFADMPLEVLAQALKADMGLSGELVVTTAARLVPASSPLPASSLAPAKSPRPPVADTG